MRVSERAPHAVANALQYNGTYRRTGRVFRPRQQALPFRLKSTRRQLIRQEAVLVCDYNVVEQCSGITVLARP